MCPSFRGDSTARGAKQVFFGDQGGVLVRRTAWTPVRRSRPSFQGRGGGKVGGGVGTGGDGGGGGGKHLFFWLQT